MTTKLEAQILAQGFLIEAMLWHKATPDQPITRLFHNNYATFNKNLHTSPEANEALINDLRAAVDAISRKIPNGI